MKLKIKKLNENAVIPSRSTPFSAGADLYACIDEPIVIAPNETVKIPTGISAEPDTPDVALLIFARSGLATNFGITPANCVGVVDSDYRGEIIVPLTNQGKSPFTIEKNMRIAQLVISPVIFPEITETDSLTDTERGSGGFGSTGI